MLAPDEERADGQCVHRGGAETLQRVARIVDHRPPGGVEARVHDDGYGRTRLEALEHSRHKWFPLAIDGLDPRRAVDVHDGAYWPPLAPGGGSEMLEATRTEFTFFPEDDAVEAVH